MRRREGRSDAEIEQMIEFLERGTAMVEAELEMLEREARASLSLTRSALLVLRRAAGAAPRCAHGTKSSACPRRAGRPAAPGCGDRRRSVGSAPRSRPSRR